MPDAARDAAVLVSPALAFVAGSVLAAYATPSASVRQVLQHLAAGLIFAAVSVELIPDLQHAGRLALGAGFTGGTLAMLALRRLEGGQGGAAAAGAIAVDLIIDGAVLGAIPMAAAPVLAAGLAVELGFLGLTLASLATSRSRRTLQTGVLATLFMVAALGVRAAGEMPPTVHTLFLGAGTAGMLYLVVEELLVDAHELEDTPLAAAAFFAGFLAVLVFGPGPLNH